MKNQIQIKKKMLVIFFPCLLIREKNRAKSSFWE